MQRFRQSPKPFFRIRDSRDSNRIIRPAHFHLDMIALPQNPRQFFSCQPGSCQIRSPCGNQQLAPIKIRRLPELRQFRFQLPYTVLLTVQSGQIQPFQLPAALPGILKLPHMLREQLLAVPLYQIHTGVNGSHQHIRRAAALIDRQKFPNSLPIRDFSLHMQKRRLCHGRQRLMHTVNHHICPCAHRVLRKVF